ncbi:hypothetical protein BDW22DRAFT_1356136 [Trametopsis cervina]|nr:hypothetical protein BDW22DRAFT_1356136 [Trametopsis cervina]
MDKSATIELSRSEDSRSVLTTGSGPRDQTYSTVFVVGPSSSGKTTLCNAIAAKLHLDPRRHIKEVARDVMRTQGFSRHTVKTYEMQHAIMVAQLREEMRVLAMPPDGSTQLQMLSDRSAVDPVVYASTSGTPEAEIMRRRLMLEPDFLREVLWYREALFVVLSPVPEWLEDDGIRSLDDPSSYHTTLCNLLTELNIPFIQIDEEMKDLTERVLFVENHLHIIPKTSTS